MGTSTKLHFDDSLPILAQVIDEVVGRDVLASGVALRDAAGTLAFFADVALPPEHIEHVSAVLQAKLGSFARPDRVFADRNAAGAGRVLTDPTARDVNAGGRAIRLVDRRIVGADWLQSPEAAEASPPRIVFSSLKGGVGRSTALAVLAADNADRGRNVLVVDMDLEAPGIGSMLLDDDRRPRFGIIDYLADAGVRDIDDSELDDFVGVSGLTSGAGLVNVAPVVGTVGRDNPESFLSKLARAMLEDVRSAGGPISPRDRVSSMVARLANRRPYDLVLVDARAGFSELAVGPLLGLGGTVLLFGTAQSQTIEGYRFLLAHLAGFVRPGDEPSWQRRLRTVYAKAPLSDEAYARFSDALWELFLEYLYEETDGVDNFSYDADDPTAPHRPLVIPFDSRFVDWDPVRRPTDLTSAFYEATFRPFIDAVDDLVGAVE